MHPVRERMIDLYLFILEMVTGITLEVLTLAADKMAEKLGISEEERQMLGDLYLQPLMSCLYTFFHLGCEINSDEENQS